MSGHCVFSHSAGKHATLVSCFWQTSMIFFTGLCFCLETNITGPWVPNVFRRFWRHWQGLFVSGMVAYLTSIVLIRNAKNDERCALWFMQAAIYTQLNIISDRLGSDVPFALAGALGVTLLRPLLEEDPDSRVSFTSRFFFRFPLGAAIEPRTSESSPNSRRLVQRIG